MNAFPTTTAGLEALLNERIVFDIGQIPPDLKRWLARQVKRGKVQSTMIYNRFPEGKRGYWIPDHD